MTATRRIRLTVNGVPRTATVPVRLTLADFLREELGLTGTHIGCEQGACGACTVLVDGAAVRSCLMLAVQARGSTVETIEGLGQPGTLHPIQAALHESTSFQCGYCAPGIIMTTVELLREQPDPDERAIREGLSGNLCRCTGYQSIVEGVRLAASRLRAGPAATTPAAHAPEARAAEPAPPAARLAPDASTLSQDSASVPMEKTGSFPTPSPDLARPGTRRPS